MTDERANPTPASEKRRHALFAGGGSAGHVYPGLAVAENLSQRGWTVSWAGRAVGIERGLVERAGVSYLEISATPLVGQGLVGKVRGLLTLLRSAWRGRRLVRRTGADVTVGTGGYVSAPVVLGARLAGVPSLLIEPNARAGAANRFLSRWASSAAVAYDESHRDFQCAVQTTGTPVRAAFFSSSERETQGALTLLIVGGSQGARQINELMPALLERLASVAVDLRVIHQTGAGNPDSVEADYRGRDLGSITVEVVDFLDDMPAILRAADLVVSRAGAITLAEICAAGLPSILLPLDEAAGHQFDNAHRLEAGGAALVFACDDGTLDALTDSLGGLLADRGRLVAMGTAARSLAVEDAARRIADLAESLGEAA